MKTLRIAAVATLMLGLSATGLAQTSASPKATISVDAKLVVVPTVVRDKHGALMTGLTKGNFVLQVDGQPQKIRYFDLDSDVPLTLGLLVDTSMSQRTVLDDERTASSAFLDKMLAPGRDNAFIVDFAHAVTLLQDVTNSRPKLQSALQQLDTLRPSFQQQPDNSSGDSVHGDRGHFSGGGTALYDAVFLASDDVMTKVKGRRALILLTDGDDRGSKESLPSAIEAAQRANTVVYAIYYKGKRPEFHGDRPWGGHHGGRGGYGGGGYGGGNNGGGQFPLQSNLNGGQMGRGGYGQQVDGRKVLERLCGETGGRVFEVSKKLTVDDIYTEIAEELRTQYRLGFTPSTEAASDGYHKISLELIGVVKKDKPVIQTRDGYYTGVAKQN